MKLNETGFKGLFVLEPTVFADERGYFMESFNERELMQYGLNAEFVQDNQSYSKEGVIRGLHYQNFPHAQTKLVRVLVGSILDVVVDLRKSEPTFGKHFSQELSAENKKQMYIPKGFAHGFSVLSSTAEILYKCDDYFHKESERGLLFNDPTLGIDWRVPQHKIILSSKDRNNPTFAESVFKFE